MEIGFGFELCQLIGAMEQDWLWFVFLLTQNQQSLIAVVVCNEATKLSIEEKPINSRRNSDLEWRRDSFAGK
jgi:hypothetical protein